MKTTRRIERDGKLLVIKDARAQEVRREVETWLHKINQTRRETEKEK